MKQMLMACLMVLIVASTAFADDWVNGYTRKDGTYVQGHYRSERNDTVRDNYSYYGNNNPYTGEKGSNHYRNDSSSEHFGTLGGN